MEERKERGTGDVRTVTEAQVFLTRECNLHCGYCNLGSRKLAELGLEEWLGAAENMWDFGIRTLKILGGEPTLKPWLPKLIRYARALGLKTALLSNSSFDDGLARRLCAAGLEGYFASVDAFSPESQADDNTARKSATGYSMLKRLKGLGLPLLAANLVIHRRNHAAIPETVRRLSDEGFFVNLCMVNHTSDPRRDFSRTNADPALLFTDGDEGLLADLVGKLRELKRGGASISVPDIYLENAARHGIHCDWQCSRFSQLRVDADGGLMLCNEYRSELAERYQVQRMDAGDYQRFLADWALVRSAFECKGCYWSCFVQAEENLERGRREFQYAAKTAEPAAPATTPNG